MAVLINDSEYIAVTFTTSKLVRHKVNGNALPGTRGLNDMLLQWHNPSRLYFSTNMAIGDNFLAHVSKILDRMSVTCAVKQFI